MIISSVGQEKQLMQTIALKLRSTYEAGGCWIKVGGGTVEISRFVEGGTCLGRALFFSSGILVVTGKSSYAFFSKKKKKTWGLESLTMQ